jgi:HK97 family phage major capsid protein
MSIQTLQDKCNKLLLDAQNLLIADEVTIEQRASAKAMLADAEVLEAQIADLRGIEAAQARSASFERSPRPTPGNANAPQMDAEQRKKAVKGALTQYARKGFAGLNAEQRDLLTTSDATGGALIPQDFSGLLIDTLKYYGPIATAVRQKVTDNSGVPLKISLDNDTSNGLVLLGTEGTSGPAETDPTFVSRILGVDTVTGGLVKVSFQELEDSSFDLDKWLRDAFGKRYGRGVEKAVTLGKDSAGTTLPNSATGGLVGIATSSGTTSTLAAGIGWTDLTTMFGAIDPAYLLNPKWVMASGTRSYLIGLKDGFGRPYFENDPSNSAPFTKIMGYDIILDQAMPATNVANATPILFGDLENSLLFRTDGAPSLLRLNERYADTLEVGFFLYNRVGSISLINGGTSLVKLTLAAS